MASTKSRPSTTGQPSDQRRERLLDIQKREQLKGLLVNKFKLKYGDKPTISSYIDNEVQRFLKNDRLTEDTLKKLDEKIGKEAELREKKQDILDERRSEGRPKSVKSQTRGDDVRSVASSKMSGLSKSSKKNIPQDKLDRMDRMSYTSS
jgi:hypothetical protein